MYAIIANETDGVRRFAPAREVMPMTVFEAMSLMIAFGLLIVAILSFRR